MTWSPSKIISYLGKEINHPSSICYWAYKNKIPIFCPALTDGSLGDMMYFHSYKNPGLIVDILQGTFNRRTIKCKFCHFFIICKHCLVKQFLIFTDLRRLNSMAVKALNTGMIILGGGVVKHHICNANLMVIITNKIYNFFRDFIL